MIKTLEEHVVMDNGFVKVHNDKVLFPDQSTGFFYKIAISDRLPQYGVSGIVVTEDNQIVLLDNFRYAHQSYNTETVKGFGMPGISPLDAFRVEMLEETGCKSDDVVEVMKFRDGGHTYFIHGFIARNARFVADASPESTEDIRNVRTVSIEQAKDMVFQGEITDSTTLIVLQRYLLSTTGH